MTIADSTAGRSPGTDMLVFVAVMLGILLLFGLLLLLPAGRLDWPLAWVYIGIVVTYIGANWILLRRFNPELIGRRMHIGEGTKTWDKVWLALFGPIMYALYIVAGLEARDGVMTLPAALWPLGFVAFSGGSVVLTWSMLVNPFFEKTVRIQTDHGQTVIDTGPYAIVRHPGYVGIVAWMIGTPLMLCSAWALIPAGLAIAGVLVRTALEDRTLRDELPGYREYMSRVRFRLLPNIW